MHGLVFSFSVFLFFSVIFIVFVVIIVFLILYFHIFYLFVSFFLPSHCCLAQYLSHLLQFPLSSLSFLKGNRDQYVILRQYRDFWQCSTNLTWSGVSDSHVFPAGFAVNSVSSNHSFHWFHGFIDDLTYWFFVCFLYFLGNEFLFYQNVLFLNCFCFVFFNFIHFTLDFAK